MPHTIESIGHHHVHEFDRDMRWSEVQAVPPRAEPISLAEARQHLRLTGDDPADEDSLIEAWVAAAREGAEDFQGRQYILATWELTLDRFPFSDAIRIPHAPLREAESITYTSEDGDEATMSLSDVIIDASSEPGQIVLKSNTSWPSVTLQAANGVVVRYKAGHAVPFDTATASDTLRAVDHWFTDGNRVRVWATAGKDDALPGGLSAQTDYFVVNASGNDLQLSTTTGGAAVDITDEGTGSHFLGLLPNGAKAGMLLQIGSRFEHREDVIVGVSAMELPQAAKSLLWPRRVFYSGPAGMR